MGLYLAPARNNSNHRREKVDPDARSIHKTCRRRGRLSPTSGTVQVLYSTVHSGPGLSMDRDVKVIGEHRIVETWTTTSDTCRDDRPTTWVSGGKRVQLDQTIRS